MGTDFYTFKSFKIFTQYFNSFLIKFIFSKALELINLCFSVNPCGLKPCKNGARCFNDKDTFRCECTAGFKGQTCVERK